jgi:ketosteroid isomerase-like protein
MLSVWGIAAHTVLAQTDPGALHEEYIAAVNSGDSTAVVALYAPDAEFLGGGGCTPAPCQGTTAIRRAYDTLVAQHTQVTLLEQYADGDTLHARTEFRNDLTQLAGVDRIVSNVTLELNGDMIGSLRAESDLTDEQTAHFIEFVSSSRP